MLCTLRIFVFGTDKLLVETFANFLYKIEFYKGLTLNFMSRVFIFAEVSQENAGVAIKQR